MRLTEHQVEDKLIRPAILSVFENVSGDVLYIRPQFESWRVFYCDTVFHTSLGSSLYAVVGVAEA